ncbi:MAG: hypothetical protein HZB34_03870 [Nitrospirae bacterium]|nr:hypothetical protein [Nitrospirota bacterium]
MRSKISCAFLSETTGLKGDLPWNRCSAQGTEEDLLLLSDLGETMKAASLCALGGRAPYPVETAIEHFGEEFRQGLRI